MEDELIQLKTLLFLAKSSGHTNVIQSLAFDPYNAQFATSSDDKTIRFFSTASTAFSYLSKSVTCGGIVRSIAFYNNNKALLASASDDFSIAIWNTTDYSLYYNISNAHTGAIYGIAFDPSKPGFLASISNGTTDKIKIWNLNVNPPVVNKTLSRHASTALVASIAFEFTGIMATGDDKNKLFIWNNDADRTALFPNIDTGNYVRALAFSPIATDRLLVSGHTSSPFNIKLWSPITGAFITTLAPAHTGNVQCLSFNSFGVLASGSTDASIKLWDSSRTNYRNITISGSTSRINALAFSTNGLLAAGTSGSSPRVAVWSSDSTTTIATTTVTTTV